MASKFILSLLFVTAAFGITAQNLHIDQVDSFIGLLENNNRCIGSLIISKNGKELYHRDFGQAAVPKLKHDQHTKYQIGSITKTYTAVLIFQLIESGRLSLDDKLEKFFPEMPGASEITLKQMLNHTSGLGDYVWNEKDPNWLLKKVSEQQILDEIKRQGLAFKPGEKQEYSNSAYYLLANIAEKVYQKNYGILIQEQICQPLGLKNTASILTKPENVYLPYVYQTNGKWVKMPDFYFPNTKGVGDIVATPEDLLLFIQALFRYEIVKKETVEIMKPVLDPDEYFGRGLMQIPMRTQMLYGHGGDTKGTHSVLGYNEKDSVSIVLAINGERFTRNQLILGVLSIMYEEPFEFPEFKDVKVSAKEMDQYTGTYTSPELPIKIAVNHKDGVLYIQGTGQSPLPVEAYDTNKFQFEEAGVKIEFLADHKTMIFKQGGMTFEMKKE
ncbi:serine hydrolase domain-containing protein [Fluviicola sp.]|uniref:serine hydrolase domain-containing protein n=1 Tax=Fluviicola sp. TaxID=1917219 RepID=UPI002634743A|nr:serine hydrolase domain-containing protein [Fluviicola sp.]